MGCVIVAWAFNVIDLISYLFINRTFLDRSFMTNHTQHAQSLYLKVGL